MERRTTTHGDGMNNQTLRTATILLLELYVVVDVGTQL